MQRPTWKAGQRLESGQAGLQVADYIDGADDEEEKDEDDLDAVEGEVLLSCWWLAEFGSDNSDRVDTRSGHNGDDDDVRLWWWGFKKQILHSRAANIDHHGLTK